MLSYHYVHRVHLGLAVWVTPGMLMAGFFMLLNVTRTWLFLSIMTGFFRTGVSLGAGSCALNE